MYKTLTGLATSLWFAQNGLGELYTPSKSTLNDSQINNRTNSDDTAELTKNLSLGNKKPPEITTKTSAEGDFLDATLSTNGK